MASGDAYGLLLAITKVDPTNPTTTQTAKARISHAESATQTAKARISHAESKTQTAKARISHGETKTQTAKARIQHQETKTQTAKGRVSHAESKTQTAKARVSHTESTTQSGKSRVAHQETKTQTAKGRLQNQETATQTALGRVQHSDFTSKQYGRARLGNPISSDVDVLANIKNNATDIRLTSFFPSDRIIRIYTGSATAVAISSTTINVPTDIADTTYFQGNFTVDTSTDVYPLDFYQDLGTAPSVYGVQCLVTANNIQLTLYNQDSSDHTVNYRIALIAKPTQGIITVGPLVTSTTTDTNRFDYEKVALEGSQSVTLAAGGPLTPATTTVTIPHVLGYTPTVRFYLDDGTNLVNANARKSIALLGLNIESYVSPNANTVICQLVNYTSSTPTYTLSYRIYYDPA